MDYSEVIDTRDIIERLKELRDGEEPTYDEELRELEAIEDAGISDYQYGETLIREDYFVTYAQELADDIGAVNANAGWPNSYIDWEAAAEALQIDYTEVELAGHTYFVRA